jgi:hypothetical protein
VQFKNVDVQFKEIRGEIGSMKSEIGSIKSQMVTKDYLDEKLADLRGDLNVLMRKEDHKVVAIVDVLLKRKVITSEDAQRILAMEPFPQHSL